MSEAQLRRRVSELEEKQKRMPTGNVAFIFGRWWALDNEPSTRKLLKEKQNMPRTSRQEWCDSLWGATAEEQVVNRAQVWMEFERKLQEKGVFQTDEKCLDGKQDDRTL